MNNSPVKSELYVALEMVELTQFLPLTINEMIFNAIYDIQHTGCMQCLVIELY